MEAPAENWSPVADVGLVSDTAERVRDDVLADLTASFGDFDARIFPSPAEGATETVVGRFFYALAPEGATSPDDGRSIAGEKRLYQRTALAPFYVDQGDAAAPAMSWPRQLEAAGKVEHPTVDDVEARYVIDPEQDKTNAQFLEDIGATDFDPATLYPEATPGWLMARHYSRFGNSFNPMDAFYGAVPGRATGDMVEDERIVERNLIAFNKAELDFFTRLYNGDRSATFVVNREFLTRTMGREGGHYINASYKWSRHALHFYNRFWEDMELKILQGGIIEFDGGRLTRWEYDPGSTFSAIDSNNSGVLITGPWYGLQIRGRVENKGFQTASQADGIRGATSGNGIDISYGVCDFAADEFWGEEGTNSSHILNLNKRGAGSTKDVPLTGFDPREIMQCNDNLIKSVRAVNGEHGAQWAGGRRNRLLAYKSSQRTYSYRDEEQAPYMQRGFYAGNADGHLGTVEIEDVPHVSLFITAYDGSRAAYDANIRVDELIVDYKGSQDDDPDRYAGIEAQNNNKQTVGSLKKIKIDVDKMRASGLKTLAIWREGNREIDEVGRVSELLRIGWVEGFSNSHAIYWKPRAGVTKATINGGDVTCLADPSMSETTVPNDGVVVLHGAMFDAAGAKSRPITLAELGALPYYSGSGPPPPDYIRGGNIKYVSDWPGGARLVTYDHLAPGATWGYNPSTHAPWRPLLDLTPGLSLHIGLNSITASRAPLRVAGFLFYSMDGTAVNYVDQGIADNAEMRCMWIDLMSNYPQLDYITSDGQAARQQYITTPAPVPAVRRGWRVVTHPWSPIAAGQTSLYVRFSVPGAKAGDIAMASPSADFRGLDGGVPVGQSLRLEAQCIVDGSIDMRVTNNNAVTVTPPAIAITLASEGRLAP